MTDWKKQLKRDTRTLGDASVADKAARRIFRGLGSTNMERRLAQRERELCCTVGQDWSNLRRTIGLWERVAEMQGKHSMARFLRHPAIRTDAEDVCSIVDKMSNLPPRDAKGRRYFRFSEDSVYFVASFEDYSWLARPIILHGHENPDLEVVQGSLFEFVKNSLHRGELYGKNSD